MIRNHIIPFVLAQALCAMPALAALKVGDQAPDFQAQAVTDGKVAPFSLAATLKQGPVVLYFYPKAFTPGCTLEAHDFASAIDQFKALGAAVIGVSRDDLDQLGKFSVSECQGKFPVATDPDQHIMKEYDAVMPSKPELANRTSYVIAPDGRILYTYTDIKADLHVANALSALKQWKAAN
jgi:peroxiredoxin